MTTSYHRPLVRMALFGFGVLALRAFVICPLLVAVGSDIAYASTVWPTVLDLLSDISQMAVMYLCFAYLAEGIFRVGIGRAWPIAGIYAGAAVFGGLANYVMDVTAGRAAGDYGLLLFAALSTIGIELLQLLLVLALMLVLAHGTARGTPPAMRGLLPRENRMQWALLGAAGLTVLFRVIPRVIYDVGYGMPASGSEVVEMVVSYAGDLLVPVLGYFGMVLLLIRRTENQSG